MTLPNSDPAGSAVRQTTHIISLSDLQPPSNLGSSATDGAGVAAGLSPLHQVKARVSVSVGSVVLSIGELLNAQKEQVLRLDSTIQDPVDLLVEGKVIARGMLVAMDDHFAVRITEVPTTLTV